MERPFLKVYRPMETGSDNQKIPLQYKGMFDSYTSLRWQNCYSDSGEFEIHMPYRPEYLELFDVFDIVKINRPVKEPYGIVVYVETVTNELGFTELAVRGNMVSYLLYFRFVMPNTQEAPYNYEYTGKPDVILTRILYNCTDGATWMTDCRRFFGAGIAVTSELNNTYADKEYISNCDKTVYDAAQELAKEANLGFCATIDDQNQLAITIYDYQQTNVQFDLFSGNVSQMRVTKSIDNLVTDVSTEGGTGALTQTSTAQDIYRIDRYVNTDEIAYTGSTLETNQKKTAFAKTKITLNKSVYAIDATIFPGGIAYLDDYTIGDLVQVYSGVHRVSVSMPVIGVTEIWEDFYSIQVQFGEQMQTGYGKLKNNLIRR